MPDVTRPSQTDCASPPHADLTPGNVQRLANELPEALKIKPEQCVEESIRVARDALQLVWEFNRIYTTLDVIAAPPGLMNGGDLVVAIRKHLGFEVAVDCLNGISAAIRTHWSRRRTRRPSTGAGITSLTALDDDDRRPRTISVAPPSPGPWSRP